MFPEVLVMVFCLCKTLLFAVEALRGTSLSGRPREHILFWKRLGGASFHKLTSAAHLKNVEKIILCTEDLKKGSIHSRSSIRHNHIIPSEGFRGYSSPRRVFYF